MEDREPAAPGAFERLWTELGLGATVLAVDRTITRETWLRAQNSEGETMPAGPGVLGGLTIATLPQVEVDLTAVDGHAGMAKSGGDILITGVLGEGGMGRVLSAHQRCLRREVAVKTVKDSVLGTAAADALIMEGVITGHLEHPNITPVHQLGRDAAGRPVLVMKRISGVPWSSLLADPAHPLWSKLAPGDKERLQANVEILMQICNGLSFAHAREVVHRDLKPDNVMIGEFGEVYLCDWGIATKLGAPRDRSAGPLGTPCYLAPEMLGGEGEIGPCTDVYLLGATLHHVLTGQPRHAGQDLREVLSSAFESAPVEYGSGVPTELALLCNRATARDPAQRPESALAFREELRDFLSHRSSVAVARDAHEKLTGFALRGAATQEGRENEPARWDEAALLLNECRFGFEQALREWADNHEARTGLTRTLEHMLELELARENAVAARSLALALDRRADLLRVEQLEETLRARTRAVSELSRAHHDADYGVASPLRSRILLLMTGVGTFFGMLTLLLGALPSTGRATPFTLLPPVLLVGACSTGAYLFRKRLFVNQANRRLLTILLGEMVLSVLQRVAGLLTGEDFAVTMRTDVFLLAGAIGASGVYVSRVWLLFGLLVGLAGAVMKFSPAHSFHLFFVTHMGALLVLAWGWPSAASAGEGQGESVSSAPEAAKRFRGARPDG